jgi:hypothetical protein
MNSKSIWTDQVPEKDGLKSSINALSFSPGDDNFTQNQLISYEIFNCEDGARVIVAVNHKVLVYSAENGDLIDSLRGN